MSFKTPQATAGKSKFGSNKLVLGFAALAATAILGTTGVVAAQTGSGYGGGNTGNTANVDLNLNVNGNNNVISIILNLFH